ncbi:MAG: biotin-dependent carboxyltransferase family protein [Methylobacterium sp.]|uniref:5-oxoprolinase subunit C family protein n=1 Tax=Methylobacterium sp. TaxID=409 RepID=UPI0025E491E0|nr:biotin-dependent carboxyltransferase family protein [Methylobacterium sp.]MBX9930252.1 biotin-dependent carboxyltransferase family protein [Methylobacterium sp.]
MSGTALVVLRCSGLASLQDGGRPGYQRYGLSVSGPMDPLAMASANALVGNAPAVSAVEFGLGGGSFRAEGAELHLAIAGAVGVVTVDGRPLIGSRSFTLSDGAEMTIAPPRQGSFGYLAVAGGWLTKPVLGSVALHLRAGIGSLAGTPLKDGDRLKATPTSRRLPDYALESAPLYGGEPIRVILGPQEDHISDDGLRTFLGKVFTLSHQADRMGYRLDGPAIAHGAKGFNIVSDGTAPGSIQVPGNGSPIVLMADRQTTGGYPKIATVISADLRRVAQRRPGDEIRFAAVDLATARDAARALASRIRDLPRSLRDAEMAEIERLSRANLAGDVVDAMAEQP